jgi:hypothetical protein
VRLDAEGPLQARSLDVALEFAGRRLEQKIQLRGIAPAEGLRKGLELCSVWEAGRLSHNTGESAADRDAHHGKAWRAVPGRHPTGTHLAWGPYEDLRPGKYAVAFRLKAEAKGDAPVAELDVYNFWLDRDGKEGLRAHRTIRPAEVKNPGQYSEYWLDFEHGRTGKLEYRVWWPGGAPLSLDRVVVFRRP